MGAPENSITKTDVSNILGGKEHTCGNCGGFIFWIYLEDEEHHEHPHYDTVFVCVTCGSTHTHRANINGK